MAKGTVQLTGIANVMKNLNKQVKLIEMRTLKGLILSAILVQREMEDGSVKTPIDLGNLRASFFIATSRGGVVEGSTSSFRGEAAAALASNHSLVVSTVKTELSKIVMPMVVLGFSANYSIWVHENIDAENWSRPGSGSKWFEKALVNKKEEIIKTLYENTKIL